MEPGRGSSKMETGIRPDFGQIGLVFDLPAIREARNKKASSASAAPFCPAAPWTPADEAIRSYRKTRILSGERSALTRKLAGLRSDNMGGHDLEAELAVRNAIFSEVRA